MRIFVTLLLLALGACSLPTASAEPGPFVYGNALAPRDGWGRLHQMPSVDSTDFAPRYAVRFHYYFMGAATLQRDPAYVAAVQNSLRRLGYYCGPTDGVYSEEITDAIARLQKNYALRVDGRLNVAVRRALHLP